MICIKLFFSNGHVPPPHKSFASTHTDPCMCKGSSVRSIPHPGRMVASLQTTARSKTNLTPVRWASLWLILLACLIDQRFYFSLMFGSMRYLNLHDTNRFTLFQLFSLSKATVSYLNCSYCLASSS